MKEGQVPTALLQLLGDKLGLEEGPVPASADQ